MKVLLTNLTLATRTGTEIVTRDLALGLSKAGCEVAVFSPLLGAIAGEIRAGGVHVADRFEDVPFRPDIIHGHHHVETTRALLHFRTVPAIFVCHDRLAWHDSPPQLGAVRRYVAVDWNCLERLVIETGIPKERTRLILNAVDLPRFRQRPELPGKPARALAFSNYATEGADIETLRQACADSGLELDFAGQGMAAESSRPEEILGNYDLVFAKARCALEALASGCSVILYDWQGLGPIVRSDQVRDLRKWNFGMRCLQRQLTRDSVQCEVARYDAGDAARVTGIVRAEASLETAVADYVKLYEEALADGGGVCVFAGNVTETLARKVGSLEAQLRSAGNPYFMPPLPAAAVASIGLRVFGGMYRIAAGSQTQVSVEIDNGSSEVLSSLAPYPVHISYHWLTSGTRHCHVFEGERTALTAPVPPRSRHSQAARLVAPMEPGQYVLVLTLVQEHQLWFDAASPPVAVERVVHVDSAECGRFDVATLGEAASWTSAQIMRDGEFANLAFLSGPKDRMLIFVESRRFAAAAVACPLVSCVLTTTELAALFPAPIGVAVAGNPKRCFFEIHNRLATETSFYGTDAPSTIHSSARLHPRCWVDERNVVIGPQVTVGPNASILGRAVLGAGTVVHAGAVIGSAGFQTSQRRGQAIELIHAGTTDIGPGCHIFANAVIARGLFRQSTRIGAGCRVGNGAFVSHNSVLEEGVFVGHGAVVNGNVSVGANAWIGPGATIVDSIVIGEAAQVSLGAAVIRDVLPGKRVTGSPAIEHRKMLRLMSNADRRREP